MNIHIDKTGNGDRIAVDRVADQAIALARTNDTPLDPRAFEVWFAYALGADLKLAERLKGLLDAEAPIQPETIEALHADLLARSDREEEVTRICESIQGEITSLSSTMGQVESSNSQSIGKLMTARDTLPTLSRAKDLKRLVDTVMEVSEGQVREARLLQSKLKASREEVAAMRAQLEDLRNIAFLDHLTKLNNRSRLDTVLAEICEDGAGDRLGVCLILCDIDHFKRVNDTFGHPAGDAVLQQFAKIIQQNVKGKDFAARYGGEEFAVILVDTNVRGARTVAESIRQAFGAARFVAQDTKKPLGKLSASFGVSALRPGDDPAAIIARADRLLYDAKESGRDNVKCDP